MRKNFYLLMILFLPIVLLGQETSKEKKVHAKERIFLDGSVGVSLPVAQYHNADTNSKKAGFAQTGFLFQVTFGWMGKKDLGLSIQYSYQSNPITSSVKNVTLPDRVAPVGSGGWSNHYILIGPIYYKEIGKFAVDAKLLGGVVFAFSPLFNYTSPDSTMRTVTNYGSGFAYEVAVGGGYNIASGVMLKLTVSFLGGIPTLRKQFGGEYLGKIPAKDPVTGEILIDPITGRPIYNDDYSPLVTLDLKNYLSALNISAGIIIKL
jgi:hypothetical protein